MDIRLIRAFVTLAQLRRYHAAAERLCLTQPALTKQIQTLEHLTGMTLFQRGRQGAQLTAAGEAIYSQACHFVAQHDQFRASGRDISPVMQLGSIEAIKRMVRAGLGYSIVPRMAVAHHDDRQGLRVQSLTPLLHRQLGVVMRQDKILSKGIGEMLRLLREVQFTV